MVDEGEKKELCILHIGMPKTGSSTLQEAFFKGIKDSRVSYANLPEANQSGAIYGMFVNNPLGYHYFSNRNWNIEQIEKFNKKNKNLLIKGFLNSSSSIEIISAEDLFHLDEKGIYDLKQFLSEYFKKIVVVAYVRPVKSFCESAFQQLVKHHKMGEFNFSIIYHKYKNFKRYDDVFGKENVLLWKFDPKKFPKGDIVYDFFDSLGLEPFESEKKIVNESLSKEAISVLFTYHHFSELKTDFKEKEHLFNSRLVGLMQGFGKTKFRFSDQLIEKVINENKNDYEWIVERLGNDFYEKSPKEQDIITSEKELLEYSVSLIDELVLLIGDKNIGIDLKKEPKTVALLVDLLMKKISKDSSSKIIDRVKEFLKKIF